MKLGYVALKMAVDVYIIREYEQDGEMYNCRDIIEIHRNNDGINAIIIATKPRMDRIHKEWENFNKTLDDIESILQEAIICIMEDKSGKLVRFYDRVN